MRYILVYFLSSPKTITQIVDGIAQQVQVTAYRYSSRKGYSATCKVGDQTVKHSVTYWAGPGSSDSDDTSSDSEKKAKKAKDSITMWLNDAKGNPVTDDIASIYKEVYGSVAYLQVDADDNMALMSADDFNTVDAPNMVQASAFATL